VKSEGRTGRQVTLKMIRQFGENEEKNFRRQKVDELDVEKQTGINFNNKSVHENIYVKILNNRLT
jgi:translation elongation factor EF-4